MNEKLTPYDRKVMEKQAAGLYPEFNRYGGIERWTRTPNPCNCCGGPVATYLNDVWGIVCAICDALEKSTIESEYWMELESDPKIAHVDGSDHEYPEE